MQAHLQTIVCKFGLNRAICLREKAILGRAQKCPYHVTLIRDSFKVKVKTLTLKLGTSYMHADLETIVCKFGSD